MSDLTQLKIINPLDYPEWDKLVLSTRDYSFFHSSAWARVLHESYGYKPLYFTLIDDGRLLSLMACMEIKSVLTGKRGVPPSGPVYGMTTATPVMYGCGSQWYGYVPGASWKSIE